MATGTGNLPNPGMSFSPFDILTAAEQNDLVENIESLATGTGIGDGAIDTVALADDAVTSDKIDFTTLLKGQQNMSTGALTESFVTKATIDLSAVPNGYTVEISMFGLFDGTTTLTGRTLRATYNSVNYDSTLTAQWGNSQSRVFRIVKVSGQNSITLQAKKDNSSTVTLSNGQALWKVV